MEVATAVAAGLVRAYAELRQLQFLLQSLLEALMTQHPVTAAQVICTHSFVSALQKVSRWLLMLLSCIVLSVLCPRCQSMLD